MTLKTLYTAVLRSVQLYRQRYKRDLSSDYRCTDVQLRCDVNDHTCDYPTLQLY